MAEDSTRRLLKVFGVSMTDCEDAVAALTAALKAPGAGPALEAYGKAARELAARWLEVSRLVFDYHQRAEAAIEAHFKSASGR